MTGNGDTSPASTAFHGGQRCPRSIAGLRGRPGLAGDGRRRLKLVENGLQRLDAERQRVAVLGDRAFQRSRKGELYFVGKVELHGPIIPSSALNGMARVAR